ncbi:MAG: hypothetical protein V4722_07580 [Bacteroidota bacterium]
MSVAEMKKTLIEQITQIKDELLLKKISLTVNNVRPRPTITQIYEEAKTQYGNTLKRLTG